MKNSNIKNTNLLALIVFCAFVLVNVLVYGTSTRLAVFSTGILFFALWELYKPNFPISDQDKKPNRWATNFSMTFILSFVVSLPAFLVSLYAQDNKLGLFNIYEIPLIVEIVIALLVLDFLNYIIHILVHITPLFWRSHRVHHSDTVFDVSMAARDHFITGIILSMARCVTVLALGFSPISYGIFLMILSISLPFVHSNIYLPKALDKIMKLVLVTPKMHYVHHSSWHKETNSNYGAIFSFWDRIFGTYREAPRDGYDKMQVGLKEYRDQSELGFFKLLIMPFKK